MKKNIFLYCWLFVFSLSNKKLINMFFRIVNVIIYLFKHSILLILCIITFTKFVIFIFLYYYYYYLLNIYLYYVEFSCLNFLNNLGKIVIEDFLFLFSIYCFLIILLNNCYCSFEDYFWDILIILPQWIIYQYQIIHYQSNRNC